MPNRILREGILSSERINALSPLAELFYRRLISVVDDYGRFPANAKLLRSACWPLTFDTITDAQIEAWLRECSTVTCQSNDGHPPVMVYFADGKRYLEIMDFRQRQRSASKWPSRDGHMTALVGGVDEGVCGVGDEAAVERGSEAKRFPVEPNDIDGFSEFQTAWTESGAWKPGEEDWRMARSAWRVLDGEQKAAAVKGIADRKGTDDPSLNSLPQNYLRIKAWTRAVRVERNGTRKSRVERAFDEIDRMKAEGRA